MSEALLDQAAGLRRLLRPSCLRSITVVGAEPSVDPSLVTANLAAALTQHGRAVLLVEYAGRPRATPKILGAPGHGRAAELAWSGPRALRASFAGAQDVLRLVQTLDPAAKSADVLLIEAPPPADLACAAASRELILSVSPSTHGVTGSYRFLKRLYSRYGRRRVLVLVNQAGSEAHAGRIFGNLSATCRRFLNLPVEYMGFIPDDERIERAARLRQPVTEAFPESGPALAWNACAERLLRWPYPGEDGFAEFASRLVAAARLVAPQS